jgi:hypothetical protein
MPRSGMAFFLPAHLTQGVILKQVLGNPRCLPDRISMEKELPVLFTILHSFRGKFKKSDFNSSRLSCSIMEDLFSACHKAIFVPFSFYFSETNSLPRRVQTG